MVCKKPLWYKLGIFFPAIYIACGILIYTAPELARSILEHLTHSTMQFTVQPFNATNLIIGTVAWAAIGAIVGFAFSKLCDCCEEKPSKRK